MRGSVQFGGGGVRLQIWSPATTVRGNAPLPRGLGAADGQSPLHSVIQQEQDRPRRENLCQDHRRRQREIKGLYDPGSCRRYARREILFLQ